MRARPLLLLLCLGCSHLRWSPEQIAGSWASPCIPVHAEIGFSQASVDELETFTQTDLVIVQRYYTDAACKAVYFTRRVQAKAQVGGAVLEPIGARQLDLIETSVVVRAETGQAASDFSQQAYCGIEGWAQGADVEVAGRTCNGVKTPPAQAAIHQIAQVVGDTLHLGSAASGDGSTAASRPRVLSETPYQRAK